jgi:hypothetical protein
MPGLLLTLIAALFALPALAKDQAGRFLEYEKVAAAGLPDQRLTIWLPPGYGKGSKRYPVLYMHDGHNLFDPAKSNFNKVWAADRAMLVAIKTGKIEPHIIVGPLPTVSAAVALPSRQRHPAGGDGRDDRRAGGQRGLPDLALRLAQAMG